MTVDLIHVDLNEHVLQIRIDRPEKKNALNKAMHVAIARALRRADADGEVHVAVLYGEGGCFTAGNDLNDFLSEKNEESTEPSPGAQFVHALCDLRKPLMAAVDGLAIGVGVTMLFHCDLVYAAPTARFQMPFVSLGVVPEAGSTFLFPQLVGHLRASEILYFGTPFGAEEAREFGLVNAVVGSDRLLEYTLERARVLASQPPAAVQQCKALLKAHVSEPLRAAVLSEGEAFALQLQSPATMEAIKAKLERRSPDPSKSAEIIMAG